MAAPITEVADVRITTDTVGLQRAGFGIPLILSHNATFAERTRTYTSASGVAGDFTDSTAPERLAANAIFGQNPRPTRIKIGRVGATPTLTYELTILRVLNDHKYEVRAEGQGVTATTVEFTSDSDATDAEIAAGLVTALNAVTGKNFTASGAASPVTVTGDSAGDWFSLETINSLDISVRQTHTVTGLADELDALVLEDDDWYGLLTLYNSLSYVTAVSAWAEPKIKLYLMDSNDTTSANVVEASGTDALRHIKTQNYKRSAGVYHISPARMIAAAWAGRVLSVAPGGITWAFKTLAGVPAYNLTATQRLNLQARNATTYETIAGRAVTLDGKRADGDFIDVTRGDDFIQDDQSKAIAELLFGADKIPFTNPGIGQIEGVIRGSLIRALNRGIIRANPAFTVTVPDVNDIDNANLAARNVPDIRWQAFRAGAIHKVSPVTGVISL